MKEIVMNKLQRVTLAVASAAAVGAVGLGVTAAAANAHPAAASHASQAAPASSLGGRQVKANERVVERGPGLWNQAVRFGVPGSSIST
jgi:hypothetical protein